jgi:hypothetical protein
MKKVLSVLLVFLGLAVNVNSQKALVAVETVAACAGDTVVVPVNLTNYKNVCAVGIRVSYDPAVLKYVKIININSQMPGADFAGVMDKSSNKGIITLGWFSTNPSIIANIPSGRAFDIKFVCLKNAETSLTLMESGTMASDCNLNNMDIDLNSGSVKQGKNCK